MSEIHPNKGKGTEKWSKEHDVSCLQVPAQLTQQTLLVKGMIELMLQKSSRAAMYSLPGIVGVVDNNGGDRVNKKIKEILRGLAKAHDVDVDVVNAATSKRAGSSDGPKQPRKRARKAKEDDEDE